MQHRNVSGLEETVRLNLSYLLARYTGVDCKEKLLLQLVLRTRICNFFFLNHRAPPKISPLPLHAALPISFLSGRPPPCPRPGTPKPPSSSAQPDWRYRSGRSCSGWVGPARAPLGSRCSTCTPKAKK